jgi:hypothetical protein
VEAKYEPEPNRVRLTWTLSTNSPSAIVIHMLPNQNGLETVMGMLTALLYAILPHRIFRLESSSKVETKMKPRPICALIRFSASQ